MSKPTLSTIKQFSANNSAFPQGGVRWAIFNAKTNGLAESGAIVRMPGNGTSKRGRILIHEERYIAWVMGETAIDNQPKSAA